MSDFWSSKNGKALKKNVFNLFMRSAVDVEIKKKIQRWNKAIKLSQLDCSEICRRDQIYWEILIQRTFNHIWDFCVFPGFEAIVQLTQEKIMNVNVGQDVQILCRRNGGSWAISWYQQKAGDTPKFLLLDSTRASGLSSRFTYTDNGNDEYLNIARVEAEDEAVYYCGCFICENHHSAAFQWATRTKTSWVFQSSWRSLPFSPGAPIQSGNVTKQILDDFSWSHGRNSCRFVSLSCSFVSVEVFRLGRSSGLWRSGFCTTLLHSAMAASVEALS